MLAPGRTMLSTKPLPTGSPTPTNTIGTFPATGLSAATARLVHATITSRARLKEVQSRRRAPFLDYHPTIARRCGYYCRSSNPTHQAAGKMRQAKPLWTSFEHHPSIHQPRRILSVGCAPAANDHVAAAPPISVMNSRRRIASPKRCNVTIRARICDRRNGPPQSFCAAAIHRTDV